MAKYVVIIIIAAVAGILINLLNGALGIDEPAIDGGVVGGVAGALAVLFMHGKSTCSQDDGPSE